VKNSKQVQGSSKQYPESLLLRSLDFTSGGTDLPGQDKSRKM